MHQPSDSARGSIKNVSFSGSLRKHHPEIRYSVNCRRRGWRSLIISSKELPRARSRERERGNNDGRRKSRSRAAAAKGETTTIGHRRYIYIYTQAEENLLSPDLRHLEVTRPGARAIDIPWPGCTIYCTRK